MPFSYYKTMKISYVSDLHLEFSDLELPGGEVLILAGDICEVKNVRPNSYDPNGIMFNFENRHRRPDRYIRFFLEECAKYQQVFYVMGNHEHYHGRFDRTAGLIQEFLPANVRLLENDCVDYRGVMFMGATLWTDLNRGNPISENMIRQYMNDYSAITNHYQDQDRYFKLIPTETLKVHRRTVEYFRQTLAANRDRTFVVITHHGPSFQSVGPEFKDDFHINGAYASDLDQFILNHSNIRYWIHGHMHHSNDYQIGSTRVLTNPRGYVGYERSSEDFDPGRSFEIEV